MEEESRHQCLIYEGAPSRQLPTLAAVIHQKLGEGHRCFYLNSPPMVAGLRTCLAAKGVDVEHAVDKERLVLSSETAISTGGDFSIEVMLQKLEEALDGALNDGYKGLMATGDMTWEFGPQKNFAKLMEYEWRLEKFLQKRHGMFAICQYHLDTLPREVTRQALHSHRVLFINETLSRINPYYISSGVLAEQTATNMELDEMITAVCQLQNTTGLEQEELPRAV
jgi:hypothetical protein